MPQSVLDAIKMGMWDYEPQAGQTMNVPSTDAMPGTNEKMEVLAERLRKGLPLWHPSDRVSYEDSE